MNDKALNSIMEMDTVIRVYEGGRIDWPMKNVHAPEVSVMLDADDQITDVAEEEMTMWVKAQGWDLLTGWTGQSGYSGPLMHPSEFVGGKLAEHIMETPGYYTCVVISSDKPCPCGEDQVGCECPLDVEPAGWAIAYRETV